MSGGPPILFLLGFFGLVFLFVITIVVMGMRQEARKAQREHELKLRALELGRPAPGEGCGRPTPMAVKLGVWVPIGVFATVPAVAFIDPHVAPFLAVGASVVGVAGVVCGTVLTVLRPEDLAAPRRPIFDPADDKPAFDADTFDVVGRRG